MVVMGYMFAISGMINIVTNVIFICLEDQFINISWIENGIYKSLRMNPG